MNVTLETQSAKVFINNGSGPGAEMAATARPGALAPGTHTLVLGPMPKNLLPESLRLAVPPGVRLVSLSTRPTYSAPPAAATDLESLLLEIQAAQIEDRSLFDALELLRGFQWDSLKAGKDTLQAVPDFLDWYTGRRLKLETELEEVRRRLAKLQQRLAAAQAGNTTHETNGFEAVATLEATEAVPDTEWTAHYLVRGAMWKPMYDIYIDTAAQQAHAVLRAQVANLSGAGWENIALMFSTRAPRMGLRLPGKPEEVLDFYVREEYEEAPMRKTSAMMAAPAADMPPPAPRAKKAIAPREEAMPVFQAQEQLLDVTYTAAQPWSILSGTTQNVDVQRIVLEAKFFHLAVPLNDSAVYIAAELKPEANAPLLDAEARLIVDGMVAGTTRIGAELQNDGLRIALGTDENVKVKRTVHNRGQGKSLMGGTVKQAVQVEIAIQNGHRALKLRVQDRLPITHHRDIEVVLDKAEGARHTAETGLLEWELSLNAKEERTLRFGYEVRHPAKQELFPMQDLV